MVQTCYKYILIHRVQRVQGYKALQTPILWGLVCTLFFFQKGTEGTRLNLYHFLGYKVKFAITHFKRYIIKTMYNITYTNKGLTCYHYATIINQKP